MVCMQRNRTAYVTFSWGTMAETTATKKKSQNSTNSRNGLGYDNNRVHTPTSTPTLVSIPKSTNARKPSAQVNLVSTERKILLLHTEKHQLMKRFARRWPLCTGQVHLGNRRDHAIWARLRVCSVAGQAAVFLQRDIHSIPQG